MKKVTTALKSQAFLYDFAKDGGAIGVYSAGNSLPLTAQITNAWLNVLVAVNGGAGATFGLNWSGNNLFCSFGNAAAVGGYPFSSFVIISKNTNTALTLSITVNTFTSGKFIWIVEYYDTSGR